MKKHNRPRSSSLFMLELIIAILLFALSSTVCVPFFAKAHQLSKDSTVLDVSATQCASIAEIVYSSDSQSAAEAEIKGNYPYCQKEGSALQIYFDQDMIECRKENACYEINVTLSVSDSNMLVASMSADDLAHSGTIYSLEARHDISGRNSK